MAIRVAEETGTLRQVLAEEAHRLMNRGDSANPVRAYLPATMLWILAIWTICASKVSFIMMFIIPKFKKIFEDFGTDLPAMTEMLIGMSDWFLHYWYLLALPAITFIGVPAWWMFRGYLSYISTGTILFSEHFPRYWSPLILRLLSVTVATGNALDKGVHAILKELPPGRSAEKLSAVRQSMLAGDDCWRAMSQHGLLKNREVAFLDSATRTGHLDWGLLHLSRALERRRGRWAQRLASLLQPVVVLAVGMVVGFVCISLFLPLIKLVNDLS